MSALFVRRLMHLKQMDIEYALWQMFYLPFHASKVYKTAVYHSKTKGQWARDDPAFVFILSVFILVSSLAFALAFHADSFYHMVRIITWTVFVDLFFTGAVVSSLGWVISNKFLVDRVGEAGEKRTVEWGYCFDIHCNSWYCLFLYLYVLQYFLIPLVISDSAFGMFFANVLYLVACIHYLHVTFLGYSCVPFLKKTEVFLYPISLLVVVFFLLLVRHFNMAIFVMNFRYTLTV